MVPFLPAEALLENKTLTSLSLEHNPLTSDGANFYGLETLCRALSSNSTLTSLNLFGCGLQAEVRQTHRRIAVLLHSSVCSVQNPSAVLAGWWLLRVLASITCPACMCFFVGAVLVSVGVAPYWRACCG